MQIQMAPKILLAGLASLAALVVIPAAAVFLPKLRLAPRVAIH